MNGSIAAGLRRLDEGDLIRRIVAGEFIDPGTGKRLACPIRAIRIGPIFDGAEPDLIAEEEV